MDSSVSKALIMIASVLLAMIVIAFVTFTFNRIGTWQTAQNDEVRIKQVDEFNREYEAYAKDLMYGMDVISCLNKVLSNNDKITKDGYVNGERYDESYAVTANVEIKKTLEESLTVYYMDQGSNREKEADTNWKTDGLTLKNTNFTFYEKTGSVSKFDKNSVLDTTIKDSTVVPDIYVMALNNSTNALHDQIKLIGTMNDVIETVKNTNSSKNSEGQIWTKAVYRSALYDMKTRKFKCTNVGYNTDTGRINRIEFKEI